MRPYGKKAAFDSQGYFGHHRNRRGWQEGYVLVSWYEEMVVIRVFAGTVQLHSALQPLVTAAEGEQEAVQQRHTILRIDAGGGSVADLNWALARGYQVYGKDCSAA